MVERPRARGRRELWLTLAVLLVASAEVWLLQTGPDSPQEPSLAARERLLEHALNALPSLAILALGASLVLVAGGIDFSMAAVFFLAQSASIEVVARLPDTMSSFDALGVALCVSLGVGAACGLINGALVVGARLRPWMATLVTTALFGGVVQFALADVVGSGRGQRLLHAWFVFGSHASVDLTTRSVSIPLPIVVLPLGVLLAIWILLSRSVLGLDLRALGSNPAAARRAGIAVGPLRFGVYVVAGLLAGFADFASRGSSPTFGAGAGVELQLAVLAAALLGGASLSGGRASPLGVVLAAGLVALVYAGADAFDRRHGSTLLFLSLVLLVALVLDRRPTAHESGASRAT